MFLTHRPSQLAACAAIISINIYERDLMLSNNNKSEFFEMKGEELVFNSKIWNNARVVGLTGYSVLMILEPLYQLEMFIRENLTPDRLEGFDLEAIQSVKHFEMQSKQMVLTY